MSFLFLIFLFLIGCTEHQKQLVLDENDFGDFSSAPLSYRVISLENNEHGIERRLRLEPQLRRENLKFEYIWAYYGKDIDRWPYIERGDFGGGVGSKRNKTTIGNLVDGEFGLVLTTIDKVFKDVASGPLEGLTVLFEDDVILSDNLDFELREALRQVPKDFDLIYIGYFLDAFCNDNAKVISPKTPPAERKRLKYNHNLCPSQKMINVVNSGWFKLTGSCVAGTWAYVIRNSSLGKIQHHLNARKPLDQPIDELYRFLYENGSLVAYGLKNQIVNLNYDAPSSIQH